MAWPDFCASSITFAKFKSSKRFSMRDKVSFLSSIIIDLAAINIFLAMLCSANIRKKKTKKIILLFESLTWKNTKTNKNTLTALMLTHED